MWKSIWYLPFWVSDSKFTMIVYVFLSTVGMLLFLSEILIELWLLLIHLDDIKSKGESCFLILFNFIIWQYGKPEKKIKLHEHTFSCISYKFDWLFIWYGLWFILDSSISFRIFMLCFLVIVLFFLKANLDQSFAGSINLYWFHF